MAKTRLEAALEERRKRLARSRFLAYLQQNDSLVFEKFVETDGEMAALDSLWRWVILIDTAPTYRLEISATDAEQKEWLAQCLRLSQIRDQAYLFVSGFGYSFALVKLADEDWLNTLWRDRTHREFLVVSPDFKYLLAVTEEEYYYFAFLSEVLDGRPLSDS